MNHGILYDILVPLISVVVGAIFAYIAQQYVEYRKNINQSTTIIITWKMQLRWIFNVLKQVKTNYINNAHKPFPIRIEGDNCEDINHYLEKNHSWLKFHRVEKMQKLPLQDKTTIGFLLNYCGQGFKGKDKMNVLEAIKMVTFLYDTLSDLINEREDMLNEFHCEFNNEEILKNKEKLKNVLQQFVNFHLPNEFTDRIMSRLDQTIEDIQNLINIFDHLRLQHSFWRCFLWTGQLTSTNVSIDCS